MKSSKISKILGLTNVGLWAWATWRLLTHLDSRPFTKLLMLRIAVDLLKKGIQEPRPHGATGCDALGIGGLSHTFGMPSGHVATAVAGWVMVAQSFNLSKSIQAIVACIAGALMGWARVPAGCHTPLQSVVGAIFGWLAVTTPT